MMKKRRRLHVLAEEMDHLNQGLVDHFAKQVPEHHPVSCSKGCAACCRQAVVMTLPEGAVIVRKYRELVVQKRETLEEMRDLFSELVERHGYVEGRHETMAPAMAEAGMTYWQYQLRCPFLGPKDECLIYDARPVACRLYYVVSPAENCTSRDGRNVSIVSMSDIEKDAHTRAYRMENQILGSVTVGSFMPLILLHLLKRM